MDGAVQAAEGAVDLVAVRPNFQTLSTCGTEPYQHMYIVHTYTMYTLYIKCSSVIMTLENYVS